MFQKIVAFFKRESQLVQGELLHSEAFVEAMAEAIAAKVTAEVTAKVRAALKSDLAKIKAAIPVKKPRA